MLNLKKFTKEEIDILLTALRSCEEVEVTLVDYGHYRKIVCYTKEKPGYFQPWYMGLLYDGKGVEAEKNVCDICGGRYCVGHSCPETSRKEFLDGLDISAMLQKLQHWRCYLGDEAVAFPGYSQTP